MKILMATFAVTLALAFTGPAFRGKCEGRKDRSPDCRMADGHWDKMNKRCEEKRCKPNRCFERYGRWRGFGRRFSFMMLPEILQVQH